VWVGDRPSKVHLAVSTRRLFAALAAEVDDDVRLDTSHSTRLLEYLDPRGPIPAPPYPEPATEQTEDVSTCQGTL